MIDGGVALQAGLQKNKQAMLEDRLRSLISKAGITDLCLTTEARYTRHLAASDKAAPFMDHPGAIDHFPSGSFFSPIDLPKP
jgi:hypothetical protein